MLIKKIKKESIGFALIPAVILCLIIAISPWATYSQIYFLTTPVTILILSLSIFSTLYLFFNKNNIYKEDLPLSIFIMFLILSYYNSLYSEAWPLVFFWYVACIATYISVKAFFTKSDFLKISSFGAIAGVIITFSLLSPTVSEFGVLSQRQSVQDHNSNFTAYCLCSLVFLIESNLILNKNSNFWKFTSYLAIALSLYCVDVLGTRGAAISILFLMTCLIFIRFLTRSIYIIFASVFIATSVLTASGILENILASIDQLSTRGDGELSGRFPAWSIARGYLLEHPFLGIGAGAFKFVSPFQIGVHNTLLSVAMDTGVLGVLALLIWIFINFANIKLGEPRKSQMAVLWMAYALPISLSGEWILSPLVWITFAVLFGLKDPVQQLGGRR